MNWSIQNVPSGTLKYVKELRIAATPAEVFAFHESPDALKKLIPPWETISVESSDVSLLPGTKVVLRGKGLLGLVPWIAVHTEYEPPHMFADRQERGPFAYWYHRHKFLDDGSGGTVLREEIEYDPPFGLIGRWFGDALIRRRLDRMFEYRHETTRRAVEASRDS